MYKLKEINIKMPNAQRAVCQNGGLISSEILLSFAALALVRAVVEAATSASCKNVGRQRGTLQRSHQGRTLCKLTT